jgi:hypothetical protein
MIIEFDIKAKLDVCDETKEEYAQRYHWLRGNFSKEGNKPFVMDQRRSRLYAIAQHAQEALDRAIDYDIIMNMIRDMHIAGYVVENKLMQPPVNFLNDEYGDILMREAMKILGWSEERCKKLYEYEKTL